MKFTSALLLVSVIAFFSSCQKEYDPLGTDPLIPDSTVTPITPVHGDSIYLDKIYYVDSTAGVKDTFAYSQYEYDAAKRVTSLKYFEEDGSAAYFLSDFFTYSYNGNDTLPVRTFEVSNKDNPISSPGTDTVYTYHTYTSTGLNLSDSVISATPQQDPSIIIRDTSVYHYSYAPGKIYAVGTGMTDTLIVDGHMNILSFKRYYVGGGEASLAASGTFTYDDKPSPFSLLSNFKTIPLLPYDETQIDAMQSYNNRLTAHEPTGNLNEDLTGRYTFGPNGLPSKISLPEDPGQYSFMVFTYRSF